MEKKCPDCGHEYNTEMIKQLSGGCPKCMADLLRSETDFLRSPDGDTPAERTPPPLEIGTTFEGMEVLELLGRGGMGFVYKAKQPNLDRTVALKILDPRLAESPDFAERFNREAKALAALNHPNIVQVYDYGHDAEYHFLIMEYIDGANLREILLTSRVEPKTALRYVPQICDALEYAHAAGIIHRDVKPENILIDKEGNLKIADFGLAKMRTTDGTQKHATLTDQIMGTPNYMAPEQMTETASVDHRADIYSLGVVFYEMLTGELPVGHFPVPSESVQVDVKLDEVVLKALAKDPQLRYQCASQIKSDVAESETGAAPPKSQPKKAPLTGAEKAEFAELLDVIWLGFLISIIGLFIPVIDLYFCSIIGSGIIAFKLLQLSQDQRDLRQAGILSCVEIATLCAGSAISLLMFVSEFFGFLLVPFIVIQPICAILVYWKIMGRTAVVLKDAGYTDLSQKTYSSRTGYIIYTLISMVIGLFLAVIVGVVVGVMGAKTGGTPRVTSLAASGFELALLPIHWFFGWLLVLRPINLARQALRGDGGEISTNTDSSSDDRSEKIDTSGATEVIARIGNKAASIGSVVCLIATLAIIGVNTLFGIYLMPTFIQIASDVQLPLPDYSIPVVKALQDSTWMILVLIIVGLILLVKERLIWRRPWSRLALNLVGALMIAALTIATGVCLTPVINPAMVYKSSRHNPGHTTSWGNKSVKYMKEGIFITEKRGNDSFYYLLSDTRLSALGNRSLEDAPPIKQISRSALTEAGLAVYYFDLESPEAFDADAVDLIERPGIGEVATYLKNDSGDRVTKNYKLTPEVAKKLERSGSVQGILDLLGR